MELQVGVKVLLKNKENKYLFLERSTVYGSIAGMWDIPGGRINVETPLLENLHREVEEETSLRVLENPIFLAAQDIFTKDGKRHVVRLTYAAQTSGDVRLDTEHTNYRWLTISAALKLETLDPYTRDVLQTVKIL